MEDINEQETIDSKYIILDKKGHGASASVYLVKEINKQNSYVAKVLKQESDLFENEVNMLNILKKINNPNIIKIIDSGEGLIIKKDHTEKKNKYIILEYASKGELLKYIFYTKIGFSELHSKLIFYKILKGVEACHSVGICHRDLKLENILLDDKFSPKICDFGLAIQNNGHLDDFPGTPNYAAPEIIYNQKYDGFKSDIFSLGVILFNLVTGKLGFVQAILQDDYYGLIMTKKFDEYWIKIGKQIKNISNLSEDFKKLYIKMVSFRPKVRPTIQGILNNEWLKEIREMNEEQLTKLENEIKEEFLRREPLIIEGMKKEMEVKNQNENESSGNRVSNENEEFFDLNIKPKYAQTGLNMNNYIKLTGNLNPGIFMNFLYNKIVQEFNKDCDIEPVPEKCKINIIFKNIIKNKEISKELKEEFKKLAKEEDLDIKENEIVKEQKTIIQIKIFESYNGGYLLRFVKKKGDLYDYLNKIKKISSLIN